MINLNIGENMEKDDKKKEVKKKKSNVKKTSNAKKKTEIKKNYYMFKMNTSFLNGFSIVLMALATLVFYLIYGRESVNVFNDNFNIVMLLYVPYLILHELLHSIAYCIYGADFKNITYGAHIEKGVLCCLCKQNIDKRNILYSLLYPFVFIGIITLIIGILLKFPVLVILSLLNIAGCSGDLVMFYHLSKLNNFEFSEYNDPIAFGLYTKNDFSKLKMFGLDYVGKKVKLERNDLRKIVVSKTSIFAFIIFYALMIFAFVVK